MKSMHMSIPMGSLLSFSGLTLLSEESDSAKEFNVSKERATTKKVHIFRIFLMVSPRHMELRQSLSTHYKEIRNFRINNYMVT